MCNIFHHVGLQSSVLGYIESSHGDIWTDWVSAVPLDGQQVWQAQRPAGSQRTYEENEETD